MISFQITRFANFGTQEMSFYSFSSLRYRWVPTWLLFMGGLYSAQVMAQPDRKIELPMLTKAPVIDGNLEDWRSQAFTDGPWNLSRVQKSSWYEPKRNRLNIHPGEDTIGIDLEATYYMAWDQNYLYLGAEVSDNVNDTMDTKHESKRWYYKDAVAWFIEAPGDEIEDVFGEGNHAFCFVIDTARPDYGAWWRHGNAQAQFLEEALPKNAHDYALILRSDKNGPGYSLEARISMEKTFPNGDVKWTSPKIGDRYRMMIVHCDPDGGEYGGHLLIYGKGDPDSSWAWMVLSPPKNQKPQ